MHPCDRIESTNQIRPRNLGVLDCTRESVSIARRIQGFASAMAPRSVWFVLNKVESSAMADQVAAR